jgi:basic membrane protein A
LKGSLQMKHTSRRVWLILPILIALVVMAIAPVQSNPVQAQDEFRVAVVMPSAVDDLAFSQSMIDALDYLSEQMDGFSYDFQDGTFIVDDAAVALRDWAASGDYDLIIAHGSQYGAILEELAPEFPEVSFAWGTDVNTFGLDNVYAYTAAAEEGGYVLGTLAGNMSASSVGVIGPIEVGDAKLFVDGFLYGVENAGASGSVVYTQSFSDVTLAAETAQGFIADGADVLSGSAQMVVGAIGAAKDADSQVLWLGTQSSQADLAGEIGVAFQVYHWEVVLEDIIANIGEGVLGGEAYTINLENGGLTIEYGQYELSEDMVALVDETIAGIVDGSMAPLPEDIPVGCGSGRLQIVGESAAMHGPAKGELNSPGVVPLECSGSGRCENPTRVASAGCTFRRAVGRGESEAD